MPGTYFVQVSPHRWHHEKRQTPVGIFVVTGSASGIGRAVAERLRADGHEVIGVDLSDAEIIANLATPDGRTLAIEAVLDASAGSLDGAVMAAGVGPGGAPSRARLIADVNFFGVVELLDGWRPALAAGGGAKAVVIASNSATTTPLVPGRTVRALLARDAGKAVRSLRFYGPGTTTMMYAASKLAVSRWVRRTAVRDDWANEGIRLNGLAPGAVLTPLLQSQLDDPKQGPAVRSFPIPTRRFGSPESLATWVAFMLGDAAESLCGSILTIDGGTDALFRGNDWPAQVSPVRLIPYLRTFRSGPKVRRNDH